MSDYNSSLPIRTENAGDAIVKVADATTPSQQLTVEADGSINVNTTFAPGSEVQITDGTDTLAINADGSINSVVTATDLDIRNLVFATDKVDASGSTVELGATTLAALESITVQNGAGASAVNIQDGGNSITVDGTVELGATTLAALESITVTATDLDIRDLNYATDSVTTRLQDGSGNAITSTGGALNVNVLSSVAGTPVNDYATASSVAAAATTTHDYTVTAATTLHFNQIEVSASGKARMKVSIETGVATGVFTDKFVQFNSTSNTNMHITLENPIQVAAGVRVRVIIQNRDTSPQDLYSTISGYEV